MARRKIREYQAKKIITSILDSKLDSKKFGSEKSFTSGNPFPSFQSILVTPETNLEDLNLPPDKRWVAKPDHLFGKRKQLGLVLLNASGDEAKEWISSYRGRFFTIGETTGYLTHFLLEPFLPHEVEYYLAVNSERDGDKLFFSLQGGAGIEERWDTMRSLFIPTGEELSLEKISSLFSPAQEDAEVIANFIQALYFIFVNRHFSYLEIKPFTLDKDKKVHLLDLVAEVDDCASNLSLGQREFPSAFGRKVFPEEEFIERLDQDSGASLKLTVLNPKARIWNILSGGGASIICLDELHRVGLGRELANYGEYSGNPTTEESYQYAKTLLGLMCKEISEKGKVLLIAGGIANFTDVEKTFLGIIKALEEYQDQLRAMKVKIIVRRGGPNYEKGLQLMKEAGERINLPLEVYGPEKTLGEAAERVRMVLEEVVCNDE